MADGKIYIIVTDQLPGGGGPLVPDQPKQPKEDKNALDTYVEQKFLGLIESQVKKAVEFSIGNVGNFTGNYVAQEQINNAMQFVSLAGRFGMAAVAGASFGPVGSLVAMGVVAVSEYSTQVMGYFQGYNENIRQNRQIDQLRTRAGLNGTNNNSRGTDQ